MKLGRDGFSTTDVLNAIREEVKGYPDAIIRATKNSDGPPQGLPINIEITSAEYERPGLRRRHEALHRKHGRGGHRRPEARRRSQAGDADPIDRDKARRYGLSTQQIGYALRAHCSAARSAYKDGEDDYPINLRFADAYRNNADAQ